MEAESLTYIFLNAAVINNFVLALFLGICPFLGVSGKIQTAWNMGLATAFVMIVSAVCAYGINALLVAWDIEFLRLICYIAVIASAVQLVEMVMKKYSPALFRALGIFLPLITTNCAILATVRESRRITPPDAEAEVRHILLSIPDGQLAYQVGESIGVITPGPHPFGNREHLRLYSIADALWERGGHAVDIALCVRRCFYIDEVSGERYPGISSNHLCDARPGDSVTLTGPYGSPFAIPEENTANILMIGTGTGIAPFRAFIRHVYEERGGWQGKVRLFYGAETGMELLYMNDVNQDIANYYQEETFKAFQAVSPGPMTGVDRALGRTLEDNAQEVWALLQAPDTYLYLAGLRKSTASLDKVMSRIAGSEQAWRQKKKELLFFDRWSEILYD